MNVETSPATALATIASQDPELHAIMENEHVRQVEGAELIASENYASDAVMEAQGSVLTNKYAEGLPRKRYYGGCEFVDQAEQLAIDRLCKLFGAEWANVQPHSGASANSAVMLACLKPGDTILGLTWPWWTLDPRIASQLQRQVVPSDVLRRGERDGSHRHGQGGGHGQEGEAPPDHLRGVCLRPGMGLRQVPCDCRRGGGHFVGHLPPLGLIAAGSTTPSACTW